MGERGISVVPVQIGVLAQGAEMRPIFVYSRHRIIGGGIFMPKRGETVCKLRNSSLISNG